MTKSSFSTAPVGGNDARILDVGVRPPGIFINCRRRSRGREYVQWEVRYERIRSGLAVWENISDAIVGGLGGKIYLSVHNTNSVDGESLEIDLNVVARWPLLSEVGEG
jgi:hypothetical protein